MSSIQLVIGSVTGTAEYVGEMLEKALYSQRTPGLEEQVDGLQAEIQGLKRLIAAELRCD